MQINARALVILSVIINYIVAILWKQEQLRIDTNDILKLFKIALD